jgi:ferric-dicitrate binding protein FerR (iron transport regulator)
VDEGSVEVQDASEAAVVLTAGQRVTTGRGAFEVVEIESAPAPAWRSGGFAASDARVSAIVAELERRFSVRIETDDLDTDVVERRLTLYYSAPVRLEGILDDVATTLGLRYREVAGGWEIVPTP